MITRTELLANWCTSVNGEPLDRRLKNIETNQVLLRDFLVEVLVGKDSEMKKEIRKCDLCDSVIKAGEVYIKQSDGSFEHVPHCPQLHNDHRKGNIP